MNQDWLTSFEVLRRVYTEEAYSNLAINEALEERPSSSAGFVRVMTKGVLRNTILIDDTIASLAKNGLKGMKKRTLIILRMGIYAIAEMDSVPNHAACNEAVALAKKVSRGSDRFVNGVLRAFIRSGGKLTPALTGKVVRDLSVRYSFPKPVVRLLVEQYGEEEGEKILKGLYDIPPLVLRTNAMKTSREELMEILRQEKCQVGPDETTKSGIICSKGSPLSTDAFKKGLMTVQSSSSIEAIEALAPTPGSRVLDLCAAPGGKSAAMAEMMEDKGNITACDIHVHRLDLIDATCKRLGVSIVDSVSNDATAFREEWSEAFDYVLADVPCSGLGVIAAKPELKLRVDVESFRELTDIQLEILRNAFKYTRPGGKLMYSTCTVNRDENEGVIDRFIAEMQSDECVQSVEKHLVLPYNNKVGFFYCTMQKKACNTSK